MASVQHQQQPDMAGIKRAREFGASFEQQLKAFKPVKANPFTKMMEAARSVQLDRRIAVLPPTTTPAARPAAYQTGKTAAQPAEPCTCCSHCGCGLNELQVQQCHACKNVYCCSCSVVNYDAREDRVFCLDCHQHHVATCSGHDDYNMYEQHDMLQCDDVTPDRSPGTSRDIQAQSDSRATLIRACSQAAAAAAASTAATCSTPFCCFGATPQGNCAMVGASGFGFRQTPYQPAAGWSGTTVAGAVLPGSRVTDDSKCGSGSARGAAAKGSRRGLGFCSESVLGGWDVSSPPAFGRAAAGQLLATSPVIPFVGVEGYCLASRALEAAVSGY